MAGLQRLPFPLQADLALSPTALLPSRTKSPEAKLQPAPLSPTTRCCPQSPLSPTQRPSHPSSEEEDAVSFDVPPEGAALPSINKVTTPSCVWQRIVSFKVGISLPSS